MVDEERYSRNILWFGVDGQEKLEKTKVAIVGVGGIGSHVAQQLAYLGVREFILIDADRITDSNLNRLIGVKESDIGSLKVEVIKNLIIQINDKALVHTIPNSFVVKEGFNALETIDYIFGCVDKDGARLLLTEFSKAYKKNYFDLATEINEKEWGGRIVFSDSEKGCLVCRDELSNEEIRRDLSTAQDRSVEDNIYGVPRERIKNTGPAVVSLNGIIASFAVTEFIVKVTGIRSVAKSIRYKGGLNLVTKNTDVSDDCYYCNDILGLKDKVNMMRYSEKGIDKILR